LYIKNFRDEQMFTNLKYCILFNFLLKFKSKNLSIVLSVVGQARDQAVKQ